MGFIEEKKLLLEESGILKTINDMPDTKKTSSFESANDTSKNILPFLLDFLGIMSDDKQEKPEEDPEKEKDVERGFSFDLPGKGKLKENSESREEKRRKKQEEKAEKKKKRTYWEKLLFEVLNKFYPRLIIILKDAIINGIIESNSCSSDFLVPPNQKLNMLVSQVDFFNNFKNSPQDSVAGFLFGDSDKDFDRFIYDTIQTPNVVNTWSGPNGDLIDLTFYSYSSGATVQPNSIDFKVSSNYNNKKFSQFLTDFMISIELFSKEKFLATAIEGVFGLISSNTDVTTDQLVDEEKLNKLTDKILDKDPCEDEIVFDDSFYSFSNDDLAEIEKKAMSRKLGIVELDLGCGVYSFDVSEDKIDLINLLNDIKESNGNPVLQERKTILLLDKLNSNATQKSPSNAESIKKKFNTDLLKELPKTIVKNSFTKPTIVALTNICNYITTTNTTLKDTSFDFAIFNRSFFEYVARESLAALIEIIFGILVREILVLIRRIVKRLIKKIIKKKTEIIKSYTKANTGGEKDGILTPLPQVST